MFAAAIFAIFTIFWLLLSQMSVMVQRIEYPKDELASISGHIRVYGNIQKGPITQTGISTTFIRPHLVEPSHEQKLETIDSLEFVAYNILARVSSNKYITNKENFYTINGFVIYRNLMLDEHVIGYYSRFPKNNYAAMDIPDSSNYVCYHNYRALIQKWPL